MKCWLGWAWLCAQCCYQPWDAMWSGMCRRVLHEGYALVMADSRNYATGEALAVLDLDLDGDVDLRDWAAFQNMY